MDDIADAAGVTKGALYHHFAGKEALYLAYVPALRRGFVSGLAEWYKEELLKLSFEGAPPETAQITEAAAA